HARSHGGRARGGTELSGGGGAFRHRNRRAGRPGFQPAAIPAEPQMPGISLAYELRQPGGGPRLRDRAGLQWRLSLGRQRHGGVGFRRPDHGPGDQLTALDAEELSRDYDYRGRQEQSQRENSTAENLRLSPPSNPRTSGGISDSLEKS